MKSLDRFIEEAGKSVAPKSCPPTILLFYR